MWEPSSHDFFTIDPLTGEINVNGDVANDRRETYYVSKDYVSINHKITETIHGKEIQTENCNDTFFCYVGDIRFVILFMLLWCLLSYKIISLFLCMKT